MELAAHSMSIAHIGGRSTLVVNYLRWIFQILMGRIQSCGLVVVMIITTCILLSKSVDSCGHDANDWSCALLAVVLRS